MPFELQIALRYLLGRRRQAFISIISLVSTLGVTVGVHGADLAMAMMTGLQSELRDRILGSTAHVVRVQDDRHRRTITPRSRRSRKIPRVVGAAPAIIGRALASSRGADAFISFKGIDPALEAIGHRNREIDRGGEAGRPEADGARTTTTASCWARISRSSSASSVGDTHHAAHAAGHAESVHRHDAAHRGTLRVAGIFRLGLYEVDNTFGFVSLDVAQAADEQDASRS